MSVERVLVVGGGIGGLCSTIALRRAGIEVDLVEKNPAWDVYGVGIIQPGNAVRALNELGLAHEAVAAGCPMYGDKTWTGDGQMMLAEHDWPPLVEGLPPGNGITRPNLHAILQRHTLESGADVRTGRDVHQLSRIAAIELRSSSPTVNSAPTTWCSAPTGSTPRFANSSSEPN